MAPQNPTEARNSLPLQEVRILDEGGSQEINLGDLKRGEEYLVTVRIENQSGRTFDVRSLKTSCSCLQPVLSKEGLFEDKATIDLTLRLKVDGTKEFGSDIAILDSTDDIAKPKPVFRIKFRANALPRILLNNHLFEIKSRDGEDERFVTISSPFPDVSFADSQCFVVSNRVKSLEIVEKSSDHVVCKIVFFIRKDDLVHEQTGFVKVVHRDGSDHRETVTEAPFIVRGPSSLRIVAGNVRFRNEDGMLRAKVFLRGVIQAGQDELDARTELISAGKESLAIDGKIVPVATGIYMLELSIPFDSRPAEFWRDGMEISVAVGELVAVGKVLFY